MCSNVLELVFNAVTEIHKMKYKSCKIYHRTCIFTNDGQFYVFKFALQFDNLFVV